MTMLLPKHASSHYFRQFIDKMSKGKPTLKALDDQLLQGRVIEFI